MNIYRFRNRQFSDINVQCTFSLLHLSDSWRREIKNRTGAGIQFMTKIPLCPKVFNPAVFQSDYAQYPREHGYNHLWSGNSPLSPDPGIRMHRYCSTPSSNRTTSRYHPIDNDRSWMDVPLTDLQGKGNFSLGSFAGKSVVFLVVSDACPACVSQLSREIGEIEGLARVQDGSIAFVALDLDPPGGSGFYRKIS